MTDEQQAPASPTDAPAAPRRSWWRRTLIVVASLVVIAAAVAVGVVIGRQTAPGPDFIVQPEPVVEQSPASEQMPIGTLPSVASAPASATASPSPTATPSVPILTVGEITQPASVPVRLTAEPGLSDTATTASGYRLTRAGISGAQVAGVLASTFGVSGTPETHDGAWVVGTAGGPTVTVADDPLVSWTFEDPSVQASPAVGEQLDPGRAIELATAVLGGIGVDTSAVDWQVDRYFGRTAVIAWQLVAGTRTQLSWQLAFDPAGALVQASGFSAGIEEVPGYPVVGATSAITRAGSPPWSAIAPSPLRGATVEASPSPTASASASSGAVDPGRPTVTVPITDVTVSEASLALAQYWQADGSLLMLPAYVLVGTDGSRWSLLAVDEPYVQFVDHPLTTPAAS